MKEVLNKQHKRYEETGDPACLHDWKCSISNGCSEEELRETIMDLHVAEQNYPEQKKRKSRVYYITDNEGFTTKVINRRNNKNGQRVRRQMPQVTTKNVTDENFDTEVLKADKPTLVDFWAEWCGPCKQVGPILEEISNEMKDQVIVAKHNIDDHPNQPTKYGVRGIPTMLLFKGGEIKATKVGATTKSNIVSWIKENI